MAAEGSKAALALLAMAEVVQVMSGFLPSPTTAYMGGADERRIRSLRTDEVIGSLIALAIAGSIARIIDDMRVLYGSVFILAIFLVRYEYAIRQAQSEPKEQAWY